MEATVEEVEATRGVMEATIEEVGATGGVLEATVEEVEATGGVMEATVEEVEATGGVMKATVEEPRCSLRYTSAYYYVRCNVHFKNYVTYVPIFQARAQKKFFCKLK